MAAQANAQTAQMWDDLRNYAMGGSGGRVTQAKVMQRMRLASMAQARSAIEQSQAQAQLQQARASGAQMRVQAQAQAMQQQAANAQYRTEQRQQMALAQARNQRQRGLRGVTQFIQNNTPDRVQGWGARLRSLPTPGGLGGVILALVVFHLAIVPVGPQGETRLYLLFRAILGMSYLPTQVSFNDTYLSGPAGNPVGNMVDNGVSGVTGATPGQVAGVASAGTQVAAGIAATDPLLAPFILGGEGIGLYLRGLGSYVP